MAVKRKKRSAKRLPKTAKKGKTKQVKAAPKKKNKNPQTQVIGRSAKGTFLPGFSGNPAGPGKIENTYTNTLRALMGAESIEVKMTLNGVKKDINLKSKSDMHTLIASRQIESAASGDPRAAKEIVNRLEGKAVAKVTGTIQVNHVILDTAAQIVSQVLLETIKDKALLRLISERIQEKMGAVSTQELNEIAVRGSSDA